MQENTHTHTKKKKKTYENLKKKLNGGMSSVASRFLFFTHFQTAIHKYIYIHKKYLHKATVLEICNNCLCNAFNKLIKKKVYVVLRCISIILTIDNKN